jgi:hypothetical protein
MSDRKYRQSGYQDSNDRGRVQQKPQQPKGPQGPKGSNRGEGPRKMQMPGFQELLRCSMCGAVVPSPVDIGLESQCPKCKADLRSCKHCRHFDTGARFECTQELAERITRKDIRNTCELFIARTSIERETHDSGGNNGNSGAGNSGGSTPRRPSDARSAFDDLFKK